MEILLLAIRFALAGLFGVAGAAKLADLPGSQKALRDFGVPDAIIPALAIVLPAAEMGIAIALLITGASWFAAIGAILLLTVFSLGMVVQMLKGNAPDCHCFGQIHSEPVSIKSLVRNGVFIVPAVVLVAAGPASQGLSIFNMNSEIIQLFGLLIGVALLGVVVFYLRNISAQQTQIIRRIELIELVSREGTAVEREEAGSPHDGLPIGAVIPNHELKDLDGKAFSTGSIRSSELASLWFFVSPTCNPCKALAPQFDEWAQQLKGKLNVYFVSSGSRDDNAEKFGVKEDRRVLLQTGREFAESVYARWTPAALFVDSDGKIASRVASGDSAIGELIEKIKATDIDMPFTYFEIGGGHDHDHDSDFGIGKNVPEFEIEDINGRTISTKDLSGTSTLLTFWSPTCPHCEKIIDEIRDWDSNKSEGDPNLIVFSDGELEPHKELGLRSPVILDKEYSISDRLGMSGTPSAVLVNENGKFMSEIAVGASNIRALLGKSRPKAGRAADNG